MPTDTPADGETPRGDASAHFDWWEGYAFIATACREVEQRLDIQETRLRQGLPVWFEKIGLRNIDHFLLGESPTLDEAVADRQREDWAAHPVALVGAQLKAGVAVRMAALEWHTAEGRVAERLAAAREGAADGEQPQVGSGFQADSAYALDEETEVQGPLDHEFLDDAVARLAWVLREGWDHRGQAADELRAIVGQTVWSPADLAHRLTVYIQEGYFRPQRAGGVHLPVAPLAHLPAGGVAGAALPAAR